MFYVFYSILLIKFRNIKNIKSEILGNNQLEEVFFCHGNTEKLTETTLEFSECVIHGLEFSVNKLLMDNENFRTEKNILFCFRCQSVIGRLGSFYFLSK